MGAVANLLGIPQNEYYTLRSSQIHNIWDAVFTSGGRPNSIIRLFSNQYAIGVPGFGDMVNALLKYNIKADAFTFAPYIGWEISDPSVTGAMSTWNYDKLHDGFRHHLFYNSFDQSRFNSANSILQSYQTITGSSIALWSYECGTIVPFYSDIPNATVKAIDWFYHRENYNTRNAYHKYLQDNGVSVACYFSLNCEFNPEGSLGNKTTLYGFLRTASVNCPPSS